ncbi:MAG TPA: lytic transglycosylase domain-containing protein [Longimicrobiales bacterium]
MRKIPQLTDLRALIERRVSKQVLLGMSLLLPATAFMARVPEVEPAAVSEEVAQEERARADIVAEAWRARMEEAQSRQMVVSLAEEFDVPVTLAEDIHEAAQKEEIDPKIAFGLVRAESSFRKNAVSPVGAVGLTQVMPATARWLVPGTTRSDLMNPSTNLQVGFKYLRKLLDRYDGDEKLALTAYNRGPGTVSKLLKKGRDPDNGYAAKVLTGSSEKHVRLMNAKFGKKKGRS